MPVGIIGTARGCAGGNPSAICACICSCSCICSCAWNWACIARGCAGSGAPGYRPGDSSELGEKVDPGDINAAGDINGSGADDISACADSRGVHGPGALRLDRDDAGEAREEREDACEREDVLLALRRCFWRGGLRAGADRDAGGGVPKLGCGFRFECGFGVRFGVKFRSGVDVRAKGVGVDARADTACITRSSNNDGWTGGDGGEDGIGDGARVGPAIHPSSLGPSAIHPSSAGSNCTRCFSLPLSFPSFCFPISLDWVPSRNSAFLPDRSLSTIWRVRLAPRLRAVSPRNAGRRPCCGCDECG